MNRPTPVSLPESRLRAGLSLQREGAGKVGSERIRLLRAIETHGSIAGAARELGLSYKAAWDAVGTLNNLFAEPLVEAAPGGRAGGGTRVTGAGRALIEGFVLLEASLSKSLAAFDRGLTRQPGGTIDTLWSLMMQTSTRNTFRCTVTGVRQGTVNAEIDLAFSDGQELRAVITERSAEDMGLAPGTEVFALIKASFVMLATGDGGRVSACNRLAGTVAGRTDGPINSEITLDLGAGKTLTAIVTRHSAETMGLTEGTAATALFKASHVILAMP
ncbi:TOBE domain-containing protein [Phaeovulum vinaykumarii]|uniref:Molybdate transport system regulatory protein n=1 Tax=Phaeovulum vinaykumarii TaxID=407234 RepID=A0A1N7L8K6_9RHOB|nr:TOBE domain-containing protein [Phaeovulum vinaykumarii]SIS70175.1 molybdate transport system regulatory protein [Phaeovulum vinaykumarii]SOB99072.1 molybdate transport system regulatory protein [Phaeovulum vinaykumarii]